MPTNSFFIFLAKIVSGKSRPIVKSLGLIGSKEERLDAIITSSTTSTG